MKTEKSKEQPEEIDEDLLNESLLDEAQDLVSPPSTKNSPFLSLERSLFESVGAFLASIDVLQLAQVSRDFLKSVSSRFNSELSLENKNLTEEEFVRYFGEHGLYKEAQCLSLSRSSFHPSWLRYLPQTLKSLKLYLINTRFFNKFGYKNEQTMLIEIVKALGETLPNLKFLDISNNLLAAEGAHQVAERLPSLSKLKIRSNQIGSEGTQHIVERLNSLTYLDISQNQIGVEGARHIAERLTSLKNLDISENQIGTEGTLYITEHLNSLTHLNISSNGIGNEGAFRIAERLIRLTHLNISNNQIGIEGARAISERLNALTHLEIFQNQIGVHGKQEIQRQIPSCKIMFRSLGFGKSID